jgi:hypothetical protein
MGFKEKMVYPQLCPKYNLRKAGLINSPREREQRTCVKKSIFFLALSQA